MSRSSSSSKREWLGGRNDEERIDYLFSPSFSAARQPLGPQSAIVGTNTSRSTSFVPTESTIPTGPRGSSARRSLPPSDRVPSGPRSMVQSTKIPATVGTRALEERRYEEKRYEDTRSEERKAEDIRVEDRRTASDRRERERALSPPPHMKARILSESRKPIKLTGGSQFAPTKPSDNQFAPQTARADSSVAFLYRFTLILILRWTGLHEEPPVRPLDSRQLLLAPTRSMDQLGRRPPLHEKVDENQPRQKVDTHEKPRISIPVSTITHAVDHVPDPALVRLLEFARPSLPLFRPLRGCDQVTRRIRQLLIDYERPLRVLEKLRSSSNERELRGMRMGMDHRREDPLRELDRGTVVDVWYRLIFICSRFGRRNGKIVSGRGRRNEK